MISNADRPSEPGSVPSNGQHMEDNLCDINAFSSSAVAARKINLAPTRRVDGLPVVHLDKLFWKPGWIQAAKEEFYTLLIEALSGTHGS